MAVSDSVQRWFSLEGQVALVTGGGRGLGKAIARGFAEAGADVCLVSRNGEALAAAAEEISRATEARALALAADLSRPEEVERVVAEALARMARIDILVNNAGLGLVGATLGFSDADWTTMIQTNLTSAFTCSRAVGRHLVERGSGRIINVSSIMGHVSRAGFAAYSATKAGMLALTQSLALEWAPFGITVNALCPGFFPTELTQVVHDVPELYADVTSRIPLGRWGDVEEVAAAALYLASPAAAYTTGASLVVDGGWMAQ